MGSHDMGALLQIYRELGECDLPQFGVIEWFVNWIHSLKVRGYGKAARVDEPSEYHPNLIGKHICGMRGWDPMRDPPCPGCQPPDVPVRASLGDSPRRG